MSIALIDAGGANLGSVRHALERLGASPAIVRDADELRPHARAILPGVGSAAPAMALLCERGLDRALRVWDRPLLGICLGMQLLFERSEEGEVACLGLLPGSVRRMPAAGGLRVPHMGWNRLRRERDARLMDGIADGAWAYFVHGYAVAGGDACVASCTHGARFAAVVERGRVGGAQFHPERSAAAGARLLANFLVMP
jgi:glutamine amidotransferase